MVAVLASFAPPQVDRLAKDAEEAPLEENPPEDLRRPGLAGRVMVPISRPVDHFEVGATSWKADKATVVGTCWHKRAKRLSS